MNDIVVQIITVESVSAVLASQATTPPVIYFARKRTRYGFSLLRYERSSNTEHLFVSHRAQGVIGVELPQ